MYWVNEDLVDEDGVMEDCIRVGVDYVISLCGHPQQ